MHRTWSAVLAGAALAAGLAMSSPADFGSLWSRWSGVIAAIGWGIDPNGSPVQGEAPDSEPSGDISWGIDPNG